MIGKPYKDFKNALYSKGSISQYFGGNPEYYNKVCSQGECLSGHNGIDMMGSWGTPILCVQDGKVIDIHNDKGDGYGNYVRILSGELEWIYGHLSSISVVKGQDIKTGTQLGCMGNTGMVTPKPTIWQPFAGTHLHLGCRRVVNGTVQNYNNGFFGSFDFKDMLPPFDPINDDIPGFIDLLKTLLLKLRQAGVVLKKSR